MHVSLLHSVLYIVLVRCLCMFLLYSVSYIEPLLYAFTILYWCIYLGLVCLRPEEQKIAKHIYARYHLDERLTQNCLGEAFGFKSLNRNWFCLLELFLVIFLHLVYDYCSSSGLIKVVSCRRWDDVTFLVAENFDAGWHDVYCPVS